MPGDGASHPVPSSSRLPDVPGYRHSFPVSRPPAAQLPKSAVLCSADVPGFVGSLPAFHGSCQLRLSLLLPKTTVPALSATPCFQATGSRLRLLPAMQPLFPVIPESLGHLAILHYLRLNNNSRGLPCVRFHHFQDKPPLWESKRGRAFSFKLGLVFDSGLELNKLCYSLVLLSASTLKESSHYPALVDPICTNPCFSSLPLGAFSDKWQRRLRGRSARGQRTPKKTSGSAAASDSPHIPTFPQALSSRAPGRRPRSPRSRLAAFRDSPASVIVPANDRFLLLPSLPLARGESFPPKAPSSKFTSVTFSLSSPFTHKRD